MRAAFRVVAQGRCSRANALHVLRMWRQQRLQLGVGADRDPTLGLAERVREWTGIDPLELEDRDALLWAPPPGALTAAAVAEQARQAAAARALLQLDPCKRAALGGAGVFIMRMDKEGRALMACNDALVRVVGGVGWPGRQMQACKLMSGFVSACLIAPADRALYFEVCRYVGGWMDAWVGSLVSAAPSVRSDHPS